MSLLLGIVLAALVFASLLWSIYRAALTTGLTRWIAATLALSTLGLVVAATYGAPWLAWPCAILCMATGSYEIIKVPLGSKFLPLIQICLGAAALFVLIDIMA